MTSVSMRGSGDEIAELRNEIEKLNSLIKAPSAVVRQRSWRRPLALVAMAVLAVGMIAGVAGASGTTTDVTFVPLSPAKVLLNGASIASKKTNSPVVIGGTTTVPADATTVELTVSVKGASSGTLDFFPAMNIPGGSGQTLTYPSGNVVVTGTIQENVGQSGELTIYNAGLGTAVVTAKIIGYSTQVTAGDINGVGGTSGQVLTNDGSGGASWQTPSHIGVVGVFALYGWAGSIPGGQTAPAIAGPSTTVSVQAGQTVQESTSAGLASSAASPVPFLIEACYIAPGATTPTLFIPGQYIVVKTVPNGRETYSSSLAFVAPSTGSYRIGLCVQNYTASPLDSNDWVNGSVMIFNP
ncbi:MAG: hypothetical protein ACTHJM_15080 [Marmoricola sp.]